MKPIEIVDDEFLIRTHQNIADNQPVCPLCGETKDSLVNCGAHENSFNNTQQMQNASNNLYDIIGPSASNAYDTDERDCFVCTECRTTYLQIPSFCPLYVLYQGIYAFIDEQKFLYNRNEEEAMKLLWNNQTSSDMKPNRVIHRYRITSAIDDGQGFSIN